MYERKKFLKSNLKRLERLLKKKLDNKGVDNQFEREHNREIKRHRDFDRER